MTKSEFEKIGELNKDLKKYQECKEYFEPINRYSKSEIDKAYKHRFPFNLISFKKNNTTALFHIDIKGWVGGQSIDVDKEFIDYCRAYFENKINLIEAEIDSYFEKENENEQNYNIT